MVGVAAGTHTDSIDSRDEMQRDQPQQQSRKHIAFFFSISQISIVFFAQRLSQNVIFHFISSRWNEAQNISDFNIFRILSAFLHLHHRRRFAEIRVQWTRLTRPINIVRRINIFFCSRNSAEKLRARGGLSMHVYWLLPFTVLTLSTQSCRHCGTFSCAK